MFVKYEPTYLIVCQDPNILTYNIVATVKCIIDHGSILETKFLVTSKSVNKRNMSKIYQVNHLKSEIKIQLKPPASYVFPSFKILLSCLLFRLFRITFLLNFLRFKIFIP